MARIRNETEEEEELLNPLHVSQRKKSIRLTTFTSSASLILSWSFPLIMLCFQASQRYVLDPRIYASLIMAYLLSGFVKRLLLRKFVPASVFNAVTPAVVGLIGNGVFVTSLYKNDNWNVFSLLFMFTSRLVFGWSTYSAEDFNKRARNLNVKKKNKPLTDRVNDFVPDLQDTAFHVSVVVALVLCLTLEACMRNLGSHMAEFYSMLIISAFSALLSFVSIPSLHTAVKGLINVERFDLPETQRPTEPAEVEQPRNAARRTDIIRHPSQWHIVLSNYYTRDLIASLRHNDYPVGQLAMTLFSSLFTSVTVLFDYLILPYIVIYLRQPLFSDLLFPFPDLLFVYITLCGVELGFRQYVYECWPYWRRNKLATWPIESFVGCLVVLSAVGVTLPPMLYSFGSTINTGRASLFGFCLFLLCLAEGCIKAVHAIVSGLVFTRYCDRVTCIPLTVAQSGEQLLGVMRCLLAAFLFIVGGAILYHQRLMGGLIFLSVVYSTALAVGTVALMQLFAQKMTLRTRVELA